MAAASGAGGTDLLSEMQTADGAFAPEARHMRSERAPPVLYALMSTGHDLFTPAMLAHKVWVTDSWVTSLKVTEDGTLSLRHRVTIGCANVAT